MSASASRTSPATLPSRRAVLAGTGAGVLAATVLPSAAARADGPRTVPRSASTTSWWSGPGPPG